MLRLSNALVPENLGSTAIKASNRETGWQKIGPWEPDNPAQPTKCLPEVFSRWTYHIHLGESTAMKSIYEADKENVSVDYRQRSVYWSHGSLYLETNQLSLLFNLEESTHLVSHTTRSRNTSRCKEVCLPDNCLCLECTGLTRLEHEVLHRTESDHSFHSNDDWWHCPTGPV